MTILLIVVGVVVEFGAMATMLGDPGPGGDTSQFEHSKTLGSALFLVVPLVIAAVAAAIHLPRLAARHRLRRAASLHRAAP